MGTPNLETNLINSILGNQFKKGYNPTGINILIKFLFVGIK